MDKRLHRAIGIWTSKGHSLQAHDFVLRKMEAAFHVTGLVWASNLYEDAGVPCAFHHDGEKYGSGDSHNPNVKADITVIASFGRAREFTLQHAETGREFSFLQENGDMLSFNRSVDSTFKHGLHREAGVGEPRISVVLVGQAGDSRSSQWAPQFKTNLSLWTIANTKPPRLIQFSGVFIKGEQPHRFTSKDLDFFRSRGSRVAEEFHKLHKERSLWTGWVHSHITDDASIET